jgi:N6-adenosine-specific RNA methylase IME4
MALNYETLSVDEVAAIDVQRFVADDAHLFMWTIQQHLEATFGVVRKWGFSPSCVLTWCKKPRGWAPGGVFQSTTEFVLYARRGRPEPSRQAVDRQWFEWSRGQHSAKPDAFLDLVEAAFPGPYAELFARRARFGWDYPIGDAMTGVAI